MNKLEFTICEVCHGPRRALRTIAEDLLRQAEKLEALEGCE